MTVLSLVQSDMVLFSLWLKYRFYSFKKYYSELALHTGKAFIYVSNFNDVNIEQRWQLHTILDSPVQQMGHGFGYTVCMFDTFAVVGTTSSTGSRRTCYCHYKYIVVNIYPLLSSIHLQTAKRPMESSVDSLSWEWSDQRFRLFIITV